MNTAQRIITMILVVFLEIVIGFFSLYAMAYSGRVDSFSLMLIVTGILLAVSTWFLYKKLEPRPMMIISVLMITIIIMLTFSGAADLIFTLITLVPVIYILAICFRVQTTGMF